MARPRGWRHTPGSGGHFRRRGDDVPRPHYVCTKGASPHRWSLWNDLPGVACVGAGRRGLLPPGASAWAAPEQAQPAGPRWPRATLSTRVQRSFISSEPSIRTVPSRLSASPPPRRSNVAKRCRRSDAAEAMPQLCASLNAAGERPSEQNVSCGDGLGREQVLGGATCKCVCEQGGSRLLTRVTAVPD